MQTVFLPGQLMPYFDENPLQHLAVQADDADAVLDLQGQSHDEALKQVEALLQDPTAAADTYLVKFDSARHDGKETLFQPLGRRLLQARRDGLLTRCLPAADGTGYFIAFR
jgi:hypothetical protein